MQPLVRTISPRSTILLASLGGALALPAVTSAQAVRPATGAWRVEVAAGIWRQEDQYQTTPRNVGPVFGLVLSRQRSTVTRLTASVSYHRIDDAGELTLSGQGGQLRTYYFDKEIVGATAGMSADLWQGAAAAFSIGFEAGAAWNRDRLDRTVGPSLAPALEPSTTNWRLAFLAAPSLAARRAVGARVELTATTRLLLGAGDFPETAIPTLALGTAYRF